MVDIQTVSIVIASGSVVLAAIYYVLQLRHQARARQDMVKTRQADLLMRLYSTWGSEDLQNAGWKVLELQFKDYDDFVKKYGSAGTGTPTNVAIFKVGWFFNGIGVLLQSNLADIELIDKLFGYMVIPIWEKLKPWIEGGRKQYNLPKSLEWFEYLYNEIKKKEQKGVKNG